MSNTKLTAPQSHAKTDHRDCIPDIPITQWSIYERAEDVHCSNCLRRIRNALLRNPSTVAMTDRKQGHKPWATGHCLTCINIGDISIPSSLISWYLLSFSWLNSSMLLRGRHKFAQSVRGIKALTLKIPSYANCTTPPREDLSDPDDVVYWIDVPSPLYMIDHAEDDPSLPSLVCIVFSFLFSSLEFYYPNDLCARLSRWIPPSRHGLFCIEMLGTLNSKTTLVIFLWRLPLGIATETRWRCSTTGCRTPCSPTAA